MRCFKVLRAISNLAEPGGGVGGEKECEVLPLRYCGVLQI